MIPFELHLISEKIRMYYAKTFWVIKQLLVLCPWKPINQHIFMESIPKKKLKALLMLLICEIIMNKL